MGKLGPAGLCSTCPEVQDTMTKFQEPDPVGSHKGGLGEAPTRVGSLDCATEGTNMEESLWKAWPRSVLFSLPKSWGSEGRWMAKDSSSESWRAGRKGAFAKASSRVPVTQYSQGRQ